MELTFLTLDDFDLRGKLVFVRVDINVPMDPSTQQILDESRILAVKPTLDALSNAKVVLGSHQSRPGKNDFTSLEAHARILQNHVDRPVRFVHDVLGPEARRAIKELKAGEILLLDNLRLYAEENLEDEPAKLAKTHLVQRLVPLFDLYVNDAFASAHRSQPSLVGFPQVLPACAGRLMARELEVLRTLSEQPTHPVTYVLGGAKVEDKVPVVEYVLTKGKADRVLLGGVVSKVFLKAKGLRLCASDEKELASQTGAVESARRIIKNYVSSIALPDDFAVSKNGARHCVPANSLARSSTTLDIGDRSVTKFTRMIRSSKTVVASGPLGVFEENGFDAGTRETLMTMANLDGFTVIGGGHLAGYASILGIGDRFTHVSTAGGAMLALLAGQELPAVKALVEAAKRHKHR